jgi:putative transcriptional regulator
MSKFGKELIESAKEARAIAEGKTNTADYRVHVPGDVDVRAIRLALNLTQERFAARFGLTVAAVRDWEYGRRRPDRGTRVLFKVIAREPEAVDRALNDEPQAALQHA